MASKKYSIPLAWLQLSWDKLRLATALSGIIFAVVLMLMQMGFSDALFLASVQIHQRLNADLVMLNSQYEYIIATKSFSERYLYQMLAFPEVEWVSPIYFGLGQWKNQTTRRELPIFIIGIEPNSPVLDFPEVNANLDRLKMPETVFFDEGSKPEYGSIKPLVIQGEVPMTEVSGKQVHVRGVFKLGIGFAADANLITTEENFLRLMPGRKQGMIDVGLIRLKPGANAKEVRNRIAESVQVGLQVMTRQQYVDYEQDYWAKRSAIGFIFNLGTLVGFIVGAVIVYQILYTDVADHIGEYATLKAMGYTDRYLFGVVIQEALILAILGFIPGLLISAGMGILTRKVTLLPSYMTSTRAVTVLVLTVVMCVASGMLAMRRIRSADPADIF